MSISLSATARGALCPSQATLDAVVAGESSVFTATHLEQCVVCAQYVNRLRAESAAFVTARPFALFTRQLQRRGAERKKQPLKGWLPVAVSLLLAMAVMPALLPVVASPQVTFKGASVAVHVRRGEDVRTMREGEPLKPRDAVRFTLRSEKPGYAAVFERDSAGTVTVVAPFGSQSPQAIAAGSTTLDDSAVLDGVLGQETFVAIFSEKPFAVNAVADSLRGATEARAVACDGCQAHWLRFEKVP
ncbi:MAG: DUF4384 domain-containing protein [Myxococcaceae bacterium]|nr:DUF4384 domain-containing protein [Myxococcaceae bacterium]